MNQMFERLAAVLASKQFLQMQGIGNEVPIFIQPYAAASENEVAAGIERLSTRLRNAGMSILRVNLFELTISILSGESGRLEKLLNTEATYPKDRPWRPSTEKCQFTVCSNSDSLMGWEMRIILRRPIMQPIPITPAKTVGSEGRRW